VERQRHPRVATFFADTRPTAGASVTLDDETLRHVRALRLSPGDPVRLVDGAGAVAAGVLSRADKRSAAVQIESVDSVPRGADVHLLVPVADKDRMLWLAEKSVELGIASWSSVIWQRSRGVETRGQGADFTRKVRARMVSALLQCGGAWLPEMREERALADAITAAGAGTRLLLDIGGAPIGSMPLQEPLTIAIGPEGGIESYERDLFVRGRFLPARLGGNILRLETAGIAALAIVLARLDLEQEPGHGQ
jgi:16S rRNA (uracil1498-N3)-methyltransferase